MESERLFETTSLYTPVTIAALVSHSDVIVIQPLDLKCLSSDQSQSPLKLYPELLACQSCRRWDKGQPREALAMSGADQQRVLQKRSVGHDDMGETWTQMLLLCVLQSVAGRSGWGGPDWASSRSVRSVRASARSTQEEAKGNGGAGNVGG